MSCARPATSFRVRAAVVAVGLLGTLGGGGFAAQDLRADERLAKAERSRVAAEQAEARAVAEYRTAAGGFAGELYAQAQPFHRAMHDAARAMRFSGGVLNDVSEHLVATRPFDGLRERIVAIKPPAQFRREHQQMASALRDYADAADLAAGVADQESVDAVVPALETAEFALADAVRKWRAAMDGLFDGQPTVPVPAERIDTDPAPRPVNRVGYLYDAGSRCAAALGRYVDVVKDTRGNDERFAKAALTRLSEDLPAMLAVAIPQEDTAAVRDSIHRPLEETRVASAAAGPGLREVLAGRGGPTTARETEALLTRMQAAAERAARGYREYGSRTCSVYLIGLKGAEGDTSPGSAVGATGRPA